ncbi:MAG: YvcK family protein, partial [Clostridia bacterium]|nr:YvcK family protein [Clostridia bacterium]
NKDNKIVGTIFEGKSEYGLNPKAINLVNSADCIIVSTGTFWSSIQPTIQYLDFFKYINQSKATKIWAINNEEDGDSFGVSSLEFYDNMEKSGLDLSDFTILLNNDARDSLKLTDEKHKFVFKTMGNNKGKHNGQLYAKAIMQVYYGLDCDFDTILFDFDDTLWARATSVQQENISKDNVQYLNNNLAQKSIIVSGNSYESIKEKLSRIYGSNLDGFNVDIWADANSTLYKHNKVVEIIDKMLMDTDADKLAKELEARYGIKAKQVGQKLVNYRIKPLTPLERKLLVEIINANKEASYIAKATGTTTVDILSKNNTKGAIFDHCKLQGKKTLYIGDETDRGNDEDIANKCTKSINVKNVEETNILVKILGE